MSDLLLAALLAAAALSYVALVVRIEQRRARVAAARRSATVLADAADRMRHGARRRPKTDSRIQRRRYAR